VVEVPCDAILVLQDRDPAHVLAAALDLRDHAGLSGEELNQVELGFGEVPPSFRRRRPLGTECRPGLFGSRRRRTAPPRTQVWRGRSPPAKSSSSGAPAPERPIGALAESTHALDVSAGGTSGGPAVSDGPSRVIRTCISGDPQQRPVWARRGAYVRGEIRTRWACARGELRMAGAVDVVRRTLSMPPSCPALGGVCRRSHGGMRVGKGARAGQWPDARCAVCTAASDAEASVSGHRPPAPNAGGRGRAAYRRGGEWTRRLPPSAPCGLQRCTR
jgi:hypothetical protein